MLSLTSLILVFKSSVSQKTLRSIEFFMADQKFSIELSLGEFGGRDIAL